MMMMMMMMMMGQKIENRAVVGNKLSLCFTSQQTGNKSNSNIHKTMFMQHEDFSLLFRDLRHLSSDKNYLNLNLCCLHY